MCRGAHGPAETNAFSQLGSSGVQLGYPKTLDARCVRMGLVLVHDVRREADPSEATVPGAEGRSTGSLTSAGNTRLACTRRHFALYFLMSVA